MKSKYFKFVSILFVSLFLINTTFADTNGVWHLAQDVVPGIFGADEDGANPLLNFTFISKVFFQSTVDLGNDALYKDQELDARYVNSNGDTITGDLSVNGNILYNGQEIDARYVNSNGDTMSGNLAVNGKITTNAAVTDNNQVTTKSYADAMYVNSDGDTMSGNLAVNGKITTNLAITDNNQLTTKSYVDNRVAAAVSASSSGGGSCDLLAPGDYFSVGGSPNYCLKTTITSSGSRGSIWINEGQQCASGGLCHSGVCQSYYVIDTNTFINKLGCGDSITAAKKCTDAGKTYASKHDCQTISVSPGAQKCWWDGAAWHCSPISGMFNAMVKVYCNP